MRPPFTRTIEQALKHAEMQEKYALPDAPHLVQDLLILALEVKTLREMLEDYVEQENGENV